MEINSVLLIGSSILGALLFITLAMLFFVSRRSQKTMESMLMLINRPEKAKIHNATRVLQEILADEITKIDNIFKSMQTTMQSQIDNATQLKTILDSDNEKIVNLTNDATIKITNMSQRLDNTVGSLIQTTESVSWKDVARATDDFAERIDSLLVKIESATLNTTENTSKLQSHIDGWVDSESKLFSNMESHSAKTLENMEKSLTQAETVTTKISEMSKSVADGFDTVKTNAAGYEQLLKKNTTVLNEQNKKIEDFTKKSKNLLAAQVNSLKGTANTVIADIRLAETSIEKQQALIQESAEMLMHSTTGIESSAHNVSNEIAQLTNQFNSGIKEFTNGIINEMQSVSSVANKTLENTANTALEFSKSVESMAVGIREMGNVHEQLSSQTEKLMQVSNDTTAKLEPLTTIIEKHHTMLPVIARESNELHNELSNRISEIEAKINLLKESVSVSIESLGASSARLGNISGDSKQQMIDLLGDFKKATDTMQVLNKQLAIARATAPMEAIKQPAKSTAFPLVSSADFIEHIKGQIDKMHDYSFDLIKACGAEIPDTVLAKYHSGDKSVFSKWLAKNFIDTDKKAIRDFMKNNKVFKSQSIQYMYAFEKILSAANKSDNHEKIIRGLLESDIGKVYQSLKKQIQ